MADKNNNTEQAVAETVNEAVPVEQTVAEEACKTVRVRLPRRPGVQGDQDEFFSVNFKNYIIKRGEYVNVPAELEEVIRNGELAEEAAFAYANEMAVREPEKN